MKITKVDVMEVRTDHMPFWRPVCVRVYTDEGIYGDGEACMCSTMLPHALVGMLREIAPMIIGMNPLENEVIWEKLYKGTFWGQAGGPVVNSAIAGLDIALWDIKGKALGVPVYALLGGKQRDKVRAYASQIHFSWTNEKIPQAKPEDYANSAKLAISEGFTAVKGNLFTFGENGEVLPTWDRTSILPQKYCHMVENRMAAIREAIGPDNDILLEFHAFTDVNANIQLVNLLEKYRPMFIEEPVTPNPRDYKLVKARTNVPIATGERLISRWQFAPFLEDGTVQIIQPDVTVCGGFTEAKKICDMAHIYDVTVQAHACGTPLAINVALHLEAAIPNFAIHEHVIFNRMSCNDNLCTYKPQPTKDGCLTMPDGPGLGIEWTDYVFKESEKFTIQ